MQTAVFLTLTAVVCAPPARTELSVTSDFPGGSAAIQEIDQDERLIRLNPTEYPQRGWDCWWYFHVEGIEPGETITIDVGEAPWATPDRAAFSLDNRSWQQTAPGQREGKRITYRQKIDGREAWFAWGPPFVPSDAQQLVRRIASQSPDADDFILCRTREGRETPAVRIAARNASNASPHPTVWIQARQHAWESGSSWIAAGLLDWLVSEDPAARALRQRATIVVVPIMDIDNVARGAGGKNQTPQDHNRDWSDRPHWFAVRAAQQAISAANAEGAFELFIDLHNPGASAREPYFYVPPDELLSDKGRSHLQSFLAAAETEMTGPLAFTGRTIPSGNKYDPQWQAISKNWVTTRCRDHVVAVTLETAWNTPHSTTSGYQRVGRELGRAIERYLKDRD